MQDRITRRRVLRGVVALGGGTMLGGLGYREHREQREFEEGIPHGVYVVAEEIDPDTNNGKNARLVLIDNKTGSRREILTFNGNVDIAPSPDKTKIAVSTFISDSKDGPKIFDVQSGRLLLAVDNQDYSQVQWTADGKSIVTVSGIDDKKTVSFYDLENQVTHTVALPQSAVLSSFRLNPVDPNVALWTEEDSSTAEWIRAGKLQGSSYKNASMATSLMEIYSYAEWSPNGQSIAITAEAQGSKDAAVLMVFPAFDGHSSAAYETATYGDGLHWSPDGKKLAFTALPLDRSVFPIADDFLKKHLPNKSGETREARSMVGIYDFATGTTRIVPLDGSVRPAQWMNNNYLIVSRYEQEAGQKIDTFIINPEKPNRQKEIESTGELLLFIPSNN